MGAILTYPSIILIYAPTSYLQDVTNSSNQYGEKILTLCNPYGEDNYSATVNAHHGSNHVGCKNKAWHA